MVYAKLASGEEVTCMVFVWLQRVSAHLKHFEILLVFVAALSAIVILALLLLMVVVKIEIALETPILPALVFS